MSFPRYPAYRQSEVEQVGEIPAHWEVKRIRSVARLNPSKSEIAGMSRDTPASFLPMEAIGDDGVLRLDLVRPIGELETGYTFFRDGDVSIAKITPCYENGKGALMRGLLNGIGFGTTELIIARPDSGVVTSEFLHYLFVSPVFRNAGESHMYGAGGQKRVPDDFVRNFPTAFPPLFEQSIITAFLDRETAKIDALVAEQRRLIELLAEKREAVISHAVTKGLDSDAPMKRSGVEWLGDVPAHWSIALTRRLAKVVRGASPRPAGDSRYFGGDAVPWVTVAEITKDNRVYLSETETFLTVEGATHSTIFPSGSVVYSNSGATLGVPKILGIDACANDGVIAFLDLDDNILPGFLYRYLSCITNPIRAKVRQGSGQPNLNTDIVKDLSIPLPPKAEQRAILRRIDQVTQESDELMLDAAGAIVLLAERRTALISAAVTGQIDVRGLVEPSAA